MIRGGQTQDLWPVNPAAHLKDDHHPECDADLWLRIDEFGPDIPDEAAERDSKRAEANDQCPITRGHGLLKSVYAARFLRWIFE